MQTVASRVSAPRVAVRKAAARVAPVRALRVVCKAEQKSAVAKVAAAVSVLPSLLAAAPALALVDERLNGDGTGLVLGVNDGALGWALFGVFSIVWTTWFLSQRDLGDFEDKDSGLKL